MALTLAGVVTARSAAAAAARTCTDCVVREAIFDLELILALNIGDASSDHGITGREGVIGHFMLIPLVVMGMIDGLMMDIGSVMNKSAEGPLGGTSAAMLFHYTKTYLWDRAPSHAMTAWVRRTMARIAAREVVALPP